MADTVRTPTDLLTNLFQDGQPARSISEQDMRDLIVSARNPMGELNTNVAAETVIAVEGTYYKIAGTTTFTAMSEQADNGGVDNRIRFIGPVPRHMHIVIQGGIQFASGTNLIGAFQVSFYDTSEDTTTLILPRARTTIPGTGVAQLTSHTSVHMDTNDYIELWVANLSGTQNMTISDQYMFMMGMF